MEIDDVVGSATGIIVQRMGRGRIASAVKSQRIERDGKSIGIQIDEIA